MTRFANAPALVVGAVLAAGLGSRYDGPTPKLLAPLPDGRTVVRASVQAAVDAGFGAVAVVVGHAGDAVVDALDGLDVEVVENPRFAEGQATSVAAAVDWARERGAHTLVVGLADTPGVGPADWRTVGAARGPIVMASYGGRRRPPVKLDESVWDELPTEGDEGARELVRQRPELVSGVPCGGDPSDIDTREDLRSWNSPTASSSTARSTRPGGS